MTRVRLSAGLAVGAVALVLLSTGSIIGKGKNPAREEGVFEIYVAGKEIGTEKYVLVVGEDSASSSSFLDFRNPADSRQKVQLESKLEMDGRFRPRNYRLNSDVDGKKGSILGTFPPQMAMFEFASGGTPRKSGLLVGNEFTILDTNVFHHFCFLARLFKFEAKDKMQRFEVVIPQEADSGFLNIGEVGRETVVVKGKKSDTHLLQVDSGAKTIRLWIDGHHVLHKIAVPSLQIEVVRVS